MAGWDVQLYAYIFSVCLCVCVVLCTAPFQCNARTAERIFLMISCMPLLLVSLLCAPRGPARGGRRAFARDRPASRRGWAEAGGAPRALRGILRQHISKSTTIRLIYNRKYALISLDKSMSMCTVSASEHL